MREGDVLICGTGQAGTCISINGTSIEVLLRSGEIWLGPTSMCREPQSQGDLDSAPLDVNRPEPKRRKR